MGVRVRQKPGDRAWWVFIHHRRQRKSKRIGDKATAERVAKAIRERLARADLYLGAKQVAETLQAYAATWLTSAEATLKASTVRFYRDNLVNHIYPAVGTVRLTQFARPDVKRLLEALAGKGLGSKTSTGILRTLSTVLSEAVEDGRLPANPALRPGRLRRRLSDPNALKATTIDPYTREEVTALLDAAAAHFPEWYAFLLMALRTGLRLGELRALQWGSIDWRERFIRVERNFVEGKETTPKSGFVRNVDMSLQLRAALRLRRRQQRADWMARGLSLPKLVFPSSDRTPLDDSNVRKVVRRIVTTAEIRQRRSIIHVMRHTFGSLLLQQGESLVYVKEQMGHASIQVTVDIYGHLLQGGNRGAVDRLDDTTSQRTPGALTTVEGLVSRLGIEPRTRRLRASRHSTDSAPIIDIRSRRGGKS